MSVFEGTALCKFYAPFLINGFTGVSLGNSSFPSTFRLQIPMESNRNRDIFIGFSSEDLRFPSILEHR